MDALSQSLRHSPRFVLYRLNRASTQTRLYTKESLNRQHRRALERSTSPPNHRSVEPTRPRRPPPPKPEAFGKPRDLSSNAAKAERFKEGKRIEKALKHAHHGENIYAYAHLGTGQVVYSLTRIMDNHQICRQLVFHGKKTVPASLRRDLWTPYFSLHFPSSYSGLLAYHQLRELSLQRQLRPPDYLVMTTTQSASREERGKMTKEEEEKWDEENEGKEYPDGTTRLARRQDRAKTLMRQRETSVADVAFVVEQLQRDGHVHTPASMEAMMKARRDERLEKAGKRRGKKLRRQGRQEDARQEKYQDFARKVQEGTKWGLDMYAAKRIALEHGGVVTDAFLGRTKVILPNRESGVEVPKQEEPAAKGQLADETNAAISVPIKNRIAEPAETITTTTTTTTANPGDPHPPTGIHIFWSDLRDAAYAQNWPEIVSHGELERMATVQIREGGRDEIRLQEAGQEGQMRTRFTDRTVHVMGVGKGWVGGAEGWMRGEKSMPAWRRRRERGDGMVVEEEEEGKSREEQVESLEKEGVSFDSSQGRKRGVVGWVRGRLGLAA